LPGSATIRSLEATDAVAGSTGALRITLVDPVASDTDVTLTSGNSAIAQVPATARIVTGSATAEVDFTAGGLGKASVVAQVADSIQSLVVSVVSAVQLTDLYGPDFMQVGATAPMWVDLNVLAPADTVVTLSSSDPAVVSVPATVTVAQFTNEQTFPITAVAAGSAAITAELAGSTQVAVVGVIATPALSGFYVNESRLQMGAVTYLSVELNAIPASDATVALASSDPSVLTLPTEIVIAAGNTDAYAAVTAAGVGTTTITATAGGTSISRDMTVVTSPVPAYLGGLDSRILAGVSRNLEVCLDAIVAVETVVTLTSSDPAVIPLPASVTVLPGNECVEVPVMPAVGTTTLTAQLGSSTQAWTVTVVNGASVTYLEIDSRVLVGSTTELAVGLDVAVGADTLINLSSSDPSVIAVPATAVVLADSDEVFVPLPVLAAGSTTITAQLGGSSQGVVVTAVNGPVLEDMEFPEFVQTGAFDELYIRTDVASPADATLALTSSHPAVLTVPATMILPAGDMTLSIPLTAGAAGNTILTATLGGSAMSLAVTVVAVPQISYVSAPEDMQVGAVSTLRLSLTAAVVADALVTLTNSAPGVVSVPTSGIIQAGNGYASFPVSALAAGAANITVNVLGQTRSVTITTVPTLDVSYVSASAITLGTWVQLSVALDAVAAADTDITLTSANPAVVYVPSPITVPAGENSTSVSIHGLALGPSLVTATLGLSSANQVVNVVP
jgi:hypothetical protein